MTQNNDDQIIRLFTGAETELPGEEFTDQIVLKVRKNRRKTLISGYISWILILLCILSIFPVAVQTVLYLGNIIGNLPITLTAFLKSYLDFPVILVLLSAASYLLMRFQLLRFPSLNLFGGIKIHKIK